MIRLAAISAGGKIRRSTARPSAAQSIAARSLAALTFAALGMAGCPAEPLPAANETALAGPPTAETARWKPMLDAEGESRAVGTDRLIAAAVPLSRFRDPHRPTLFAFWATYCPPCFAELPLLREVHRKGQTAVVSVSLDADQTKLAAAALAHHKVEHRSVVLTKGSLPTVGDRLPEGLPFALLLDANGQVVGTHSGLLDSAAWRALSQRVSRASSPVAPSR